jgi:hypothetical protein
MKSGDQSMKEFEQTNPSQPAICKIASQAANPSPAEIQTPDD